MTEIQKYNYEVTPVACPFLRRLQAYNTQILDKTSMELVELFVTTFGPERIKELRDLGSLKVEDADRFMMVMFRMEDIGVTPGKHPSRQIERLRKILQTIKDHPFILYTTEERGKRVYNDLPLIKFRKVDSDGMCTVIFNDALRYLFFPDKFFGLISFALLKEIRKCNFYAGIIYEEACSYVGLRVHSGQDPYFSWSLKEAREKFGFDRMYNFDEKRITYSTEVIKSMRPNNMMRRIIMPALAVLEDFFKDEKLEFWLDLQTSVDLKSMGPGRPPKEIFRFYIRRKKREEISDSMQKGEHPDLFGYEEMDTLYYIREELREILKSKKYIEMIMGQLKNNEQKGTHEEVLSTIKNKRSDYNGRPKDERGKLILSILGREHHLGDPSYFGTTDNVDSTFWPGPEDIEGRIRTMIESPEIKDRAAQDFNLSSQEVDNLLQGSFYQNCLKNGKLKKGWDDAVDYFFNWINILALRGQLNKMIYGDNEQTNSNFRFTTSSKFGRTAAYFLNESAE